MISLQAGQRGTLVVTGVDVDGNRVDLIPGEDVFSFTLGAAGIIELVDNGYPSADPQPELTATITALADGAVDFTVTDTVTSSGATFTVHDSVEVGSPTPPPAPTTSSVAGLSLNWRLES